MGGLVFAALPPGVPRARAAEDSLTTLGLCRILQIPRPRRGAGHRSGAMPAGQLSRGDGWRVTRSACDTWVRDQYATTPTRVRGSPPPAPGCGTATRTARPHEGGPRTRIPNRLHRRSPTPDNNRICRRVRAVDVDLRLDTTPRGGPPTTWPTAPAALRPHRAPRTSQRLLPSATATTNSTWRPTSEASSQLGCSAPTRRGATRSTMRDTTRQTRVPASAMAVNPTT
jgi:hypothetical protein